MNLPYAKYFITFYKWNYFYTDLVTFENITFSYPVFILFYYHMSDIQVHGLVIS